MKLGLDVFVKKIFRSNGKAGLGMPLLDAFSLTMSAILDSDCNPSRFSFQPRAHWLKHS